MALNIQQIRERYPDIYNGISDRGVVAHLQQTLYPELSFDELANRLGYQEQTPVETAEDTEGDGVRGFKNTFRQVPQFGYGLLAAGGAVGEKILGEDSIATGIKKFGVEGYNKASEELAKHTKDTDSVSYSWEQAKQGNLGALVDWMQYGIGYAGGQGLQMLATAGLGSAIGKATAGTVAKEFAEKMVAKEAAKIATTEAAKTMSADAIKAAAVANVASKIGETAALGAAAIGMEGGEIGGDLVATAEKEGKTLSGDQLAQAFGATLGAGSLEFIGDKLGLDVLTGKSKLFKMGDTLPGLGGKAVRGALAGTAVAPAEGATEYGQTLIEEWGKGNDPFSAEAKQQATDAAWLGALGGGAMGGVGGLLSTAKPIADAKTVDEAIEAAGASLDADKIVRDNTVEGKPIKDVIESQFREGSYNPFAGAWETPTASGKSRADTIIEQATQEGIPLQGAIDSRYQNTGYVPGQVGELWETPTSAEDIQKQVEINRANIEKGLLSESTKQPDQANAPHTDEETATDNTGATGDNQGAGGDNRIASSVIESTDGGVDVRRASGDVVQQQTPDIGSTNSAVDRRALGPNYQKGFQAAQEGQPRTLPSKFKNPNAKAAQEWLKGYDEYQTNQAQSVPSNPAADTSRNETAAGSGESQPDVSAQALDGFTFEETQELIKASQNPRIADKLNNWARGRFGKERVNGRDFNQEIERLGTKKNQEISNIQFDNLGINGINDYVKDEYKPKHKGNARELWADAERLYPGNKPAQEAYHALMQGSNVKDLNELRQWAKDNAYTPETANAVDSVASEIFYAPETKSEAKESEIIKAKNGLKVGIYKSNTSSSTPAYKVDEAGDIFRSDGMGGWKKLSSNAKNPSHNINDVKWQLQNRADDYSFTNEQPNDQSQNPTEKKTAAEKKVDEQDDELVSGAKNQKQGVSSAISGKTEEEVSKDEQQPIQPARPETPTVKQQSSIQPTNDADSDVDSVSQSSNSQAKLEPTFADVPLDFVMSQKVQTDVADIPAHEFIQRYEERIKEAEANIQRLEKYIDCMRGK